MTLSGETVLIPDGGMVLTPDGPILSRLDGVVVGEPLLSGVILSGITVGIVLPGDGTALMVAGEITGGGTDR